jgi:hypothetical protein
VTVAMANARWLATRPGPGYELQPYGLFTAANGPLDLPPRAIMGGLQFETPYCGLPTCYAISCSPGSKAAALVGGYTLVNADPFTVLKGSLCGFSNDSASEQRTRDLVINNLLAGEQREVEAVFSRGLCGQSPGLSTSGATVVAPLATNNIVTAFGVLEAAYGAAYGLPGVFHVPLLAMPAVKNAHLAEFNRGKWYTPSGNVVSFGNYAGYSPADAAPAAGHTWIYLTGPTTVYRSADIFLSPWGESVDKATNQIKRFAEREYVVTYECVAFATDTDLTTCC